MKPLFAAAAATLLAANIAHAQPRDSRGIVVQSEQATAPEGTNQVPPAQPGTTFVYAPNQQAVFATRPATTTYPPCERGQTDRCVQTYENRATRAPRR